MKKESRQLTVYLSKSLKTDNKDLNAVRNQLIALGYLIREYKGGPYDPRLRAEADFTLVLPYEPPYEISTSTWAIGTGKGQYNEVKSSVLEKQPCFVYMGCEDGDIMMSKCKEDVDDHWIDNPNSWKSNYGTVQSFVFGHIPVSLDTFITNEAFASNYKLLLIIN